MSRLGSPNGPFESRGYRWKVLANLNYNNSTSGSHFTVEQFQSELATGKYGVLFSAGHAGNAGIAVEHFDPANLFSPQDIERRLRELESAGYSISDRGTANGDVAGFILGNEMVISVTSNFIKNHSVNLGKDGVVMGLC